MFLIDTESLLADWQPFGSLKQKALAEARKQVHTAVQLPAMIARSYLPASTTDENGSLVWNFAHRALITQPIQKDDVEWHVGLEIPSFTLHFFHGMWNDVQSLSLDGKTRDEAMAWLRERLMEQSFDVLRLVENLPYTLPDFIDAGNTKFKLTDKAMFNELAGYYSNAAAVLQLFTDQIPDPPAIRCWPHHFDIAALLTMKPHVDESQNEVIGIGLSPGDEAADAPYFYINTFPYTPYEHLEPYPIEGGGEYHADEHWSGAVLTASVITKKKNAESQIESITTFFQTGIQSIRTAMGFEGDYPPRLEDVYDVEYDEDADFGDDDDDIDSDGKDQD